MSAGRPDCWITFATVKVLPDPVMPSRTWCLSPRARPSISSPMALGWSPLGSKCVLRRNSAGIGGSGNYPTGPGARARRGYSPAYRDLLPQLYRAPVRPVAKILPVAGGAGGPGLDHGGGDGGALGPLPGAGAGHDGVVLPRTCSRRGLLAQLGVLRRMAVGAGASAGRKEQDEREEQDEEEPRQGRETG